MLPEAWRQAMRASPTAVLFTDDVESIRLRVGKFNMPALTGPAETLRYGDVWNAGPQITAVHAEELAKLGFKATSVYKLVDDEPVPSLTAQGRENRARSYEIIPVVTPALASALQAKGQRLLLWVTWSGLEIFHTPASTPVEQINSSYWLFDIATQRLLWSGGLADTRDSDLKASEVTQKLEADQFAAIRRIVVEHYRLAYRHEEDTVPWLLGTLGAK